MKAALLVRAGVGPAGLEIADVPEPVPAPHELLVQVRAVSASKLELEQTMAGVGLGRSVRLPRVLGMDPAGIVVAQGPDVVTDRVGEHVVVKPNLVCAACRYCTAGAESDCLHQTLLGLHQDGGAAEFVAVPAAAAFAVDRSLDLTTAAAAVHTVSVALHMLRRAGSPGPRSTVLVLGASGAVGSAAVQLAARDGATVIAGVADHAKAARALSDGASATVDSTSPRELAAAVREHAGDGVNAILDATGVAELLSAALDALAWRGVAVTCASQPGGRLSVDLGALYRSRRSVLGVAGTDYADVRDALNEVAAARVVPRIGATFELAQSRAAYAALASRSVAGRVMITLKN